jgi:hypothetical protein
MIYDDPLTPRDGVPGHHVPTEPIMRKILAFAILLALPASARAQVMLVASVLPEAAAPGDEIVIRGFGFTPTTQVAFQASVGGALGLETKVVVPTSVSFLEIVVTMPSFASFTAPPSPLAGDPFGIVYSFDGGSAISNALAVFFMECTFGQSTTAGLGTTQSDGKHAATSFTALGGPPVPGNASFVLTLDNAVPGSPAALGFGLPSFFPLPIGDGLLMLQWNPGPEVLPFGFIADADGRATFPVAIPNISLNMTIAIQWGFVDAGNNVVCVAKALLVQL